MRNIGVNRPGVYYDADDSRIINSKSDSKCVGIIAVYSLESKAYIIDNIFDVFNTFGYLSNISKLCVASLKNGAKKVIAVPIEESSLSSYTSALNLLLAQEEVYVVVCDSTEVEIQSMIMQGINTSLNNLHERIGVIACPDSSDYVQWASNFNLARMVLTAQTPIDKNGATQSSIILASALAGLIASNSGVKGTLDGEELKGIYNLDAQLSGENINTYISYGITPFEFKNSKVKVIRAITSLKSADDGENQFASVNSVLILDYVLDNLRTLLNKNLAGCKNHSKIKSSIITQAMIQLENFKELGVIKDYDKPVVSQSSIVNNEYTILLSFKITSSLNQIHILTYIRA